MAFLLPLLTTLVLCAYGAVGSLGCDLPQDSGLLSGKSLELLGQMQRLSPFLCLKDRRDFQFPQEVVDGSQSQKAQAVSVLQVMLQQTFDLFHSEHSSAAWNKTLLDQLHTELHQQLEDLQTCLAQMTGEGEPVLATEDPTLALGRYFQGVCLYLEEKKYSDCAWEIVRVEIMRAFSSLAKLPERLRRKDGDLGSP